MLVRGKAETPFSMRLIKATRDHLHVAFIVIMHLWLGPQYLEQKKFSRLSLI